MSRDKPPTAKETRESFKKWLKRRGFEYEYDQQVRREQWHQKHHESKRVKQKAKRTPKAP